MNSLLIQGGRLFDPTSGLNGASDLLIQGGKIERIEEVIEPLDAEVIDARGLWVLAGLMDIHVHLREPGGEHKETIASGTRAAAAGGFTAVACEPNTSPPCDSSERLANVIDIARRDAVVGVLPKCAITLGQRGSELTDLDALRAAGAAAASDDGFSVADPEVMRHALVAAKDAGIPLTLHVDGPEMMERDIGLSAEFDYPVHFSHVSLAEEAELIARARSKGLRITGEATPHHLALTRDDVPSKDADFKMNPPLASPTDRAALRSAVAGDVLTVIGSDHAPHAPEEKAWPYEDAPPGVIGLETTLGVLWTYLVREESVSPEALFQALTVGPAGVLGVRESHLRRGALANVTVFDPNHVWVVDPDQFYSKGRNCPFAGRRLRGKPVMTIVDGRIVMRDGRVVSPGVNE